MRRYGTIFLLWCSACTGKIDDSAPPDDSEPTVTDDSGTTDDTGPTKSGYRWAGEYTGTWNIVHRDPDSNAPLATCSGTNSVTVSQAGEISVTCTMSDCEPNKKQTKKWNAYGGTKSCVMENGTVEDDDDAFSNYGTVDVTLSGAKDSCAFNTEWIFNDLHETKVTATRQVSIDDENDHCLETAPTFNFFAQIPED